MIRVGWGLVLASVLAASGLAAQDADSRAGGIDALKTPPSPGFSILGIQPSSIERPTTPVALGLSLYSATDRGTVIPDAYALELAPYWLVPRPELSFPEVYRPSLLQTIKQSFALSVATKTAESDSAATRMGVGFRVQLLAGRPTPAADVVEDSMRAVTATRLDLLNRANAATDPDSTRLLQARADSLEATQDSLREAFNAKQAERAGLRWEVSGAFAADFPGARFDDAEVSDWGLWTTLSFRPTAAGFDILALARLQQVRVRAADGVAGTVLGDQRVVDFGVRGVYGRGSASASLEVLGRAALDFRPASGDGSGAMAYDGSYRVAANVEYRLSRRAALSWTLGRGFAAPGVDAGALISLLGIRWAPGQDLPLPFGGG